MLRSVEARRRLALARPEDQFAFDLPASLGGRSTPWQAEGLALIADTAPNGETEITLRLDGAFVLEIEAELPPAIPDSWQVLLTRLGTAPDGSPEPLAALSLSTENFIGWMAYTQGGETWTNSHEYQPSQIVSIVIAQGATHGAWIDGDPVGRVDGGLAHTLLDGPWRWRLGSGEYGGEPADPFGGTVRRLRAWA
ncbi:hypothetical protein G7085_01165 [Tessaracoccus sp. HDW20]|uniref:hypothetical protein n=1 Tax=Tessaracoccus coleopterorum TaxID=2714950 RepID=UPI0018D27B46|nr:hypothetical protein [Tessaracoccus coleopterorum]NHB83779.1 hypothetical protein [Tessaracoccus coleopterorum]